MMKEVKIIHLEILHSNPDPKSKLRFEEVRPDKNQKIRMRTRSTMTKLI